MNMEKMSKPAWPHNGELVPQGFVRICVHVGDLSTQNRPLRGVEGEPTQADLGNMPIPPLTAAFARTQEFCGPLPHVEIKRETPTTPPSRLSWGLLPSREGRSGQHVQPKCPPSPNPIINNK